MTEEQIMQGALIKIRDLGARDQCGNCADMCEVAKKALSQVRAIRQEQEQQWEGVMRELY